MRVYPPQDENLHAPSPQRFWNESYYINFFDARASWGGATRISFSPNQKFADGFICLYLPDGTTGFIRTWDSLDNAPSQQAVGALNFTCIEPFQAWRVEYDGPIYHFAEPDTMANFNRTMLAAVPQKHLTLQLDFSPLHPPFDFHDSMRIQFLPARELLAKAHPRLWLRNLQSLIRKAPLVRTMSGASHYEQAGRIQGTLEIDGESVAITGFGQRDHSWGVRDMRVPANWRWLSCQFGGTFCFNATQVDVLALRVAGGYIFHDDQLDVIINWVCRPHYTSDKKLESLAVTLTTRSGKSFDLRGKPLTNIPVLAPAENSLTRVTESRGLYAWQGQTAFGIIEFMEQLA